MDINTNDLQKNIASKFADRIELVRPSAIRELLRLGADPSITSFGGGYPDPSLFPIEGLQEIYAQVVTDDGRSHLQYTESQGNLRLRELIAEQAASEGMKVDPSEVLILHGAQQGIDLVSKLLVNPGDTIVTENPTFLGALISFNQYQPRYLPVDLDHDGLDTAKLREALQSTSGIAFIYTIPDFQNPTGTSMSLKRREELLALADEFDVLILEDTPYRKLRYEGEQLPTLKSLDERGRVIHLGSFSKTLAPGLRTGWAVASTPIIEKLSLLKLASDTQSSTLNMEVVARFLEQFDLDEHVRGAREVYRHKRDLMLQTMTEFFPSDVSFTRPEGGLFTWVEFPEGFESVSFMADYAIPEAGVAYVPGATFFPRAPRPNFARFSYSGIGDEKMRDALQRIGTLLERELHTAPEGARA